jgi:hypothetical protein
MSEDNSVLPESGKDAENDESCTIEAEEPEVSTAGNRRIEYPVMAGAQRPRQSDLTLTL